MKTIALGTNWALLLTGCLGGSGATSDGGSIRDSSLRPDAQTFDSGSAPSSDGSTRDEGGANPSDAGQADGGREWSPCPTGAIFCEDFEGLDLGPAASSAWTVVRPGGDTPNTISVDDERVRGTRALHVHTERNGYGFILVEAPSNTFFGRMYVYVEALPTGPQYGHFTLVELESADTLMVVRPVGGQPVDGVSYWGVGSDRGSTGDWTDWHRSAPATSARWLCIEWELRDSDSFVAMTVDGVHNQELSASRQDRPAFDFPPFSGVKIGWEDYNSNAVPDHFDVWIDDIAFDDQPIGCEPSR